jgi:hypothetical protein
MDREVIRQKIGQSFRLRPLPSFYTRDGDRLPFRDDLWILRHVSEDQAEFKTRQTGVAFKIELADLEEIRIPDYLIINCDITVTGDKATLVSRKQPDDELIRRVRRPEETSKR